MRCIQVDFVLLWYTSLIKLGVFCWITQEKHWEKSLLFSLWICQKFDINWGEWCGMADCPGCTWWGGHLQLLWDGLSCQRNEECTNQAFWVFDCLITGIAKWFRVSGCKSCSFVEFRMPFINFSLTNLSCIWSYTTSSLDFLTSRSPSEIQTSGFG